MGRKCCVTNCDGNYDDSKREKTFRLPKDPDERQRWLTVIPRDNIPDSKHTVVCERHWPRNYATITLRGKARPCDPPSVFTCVKQSLIPSKPPPARPTSRALTGFRSVLSDELTSFNQQDKIENFEGLCSSILTRKFHGVEVITTLTETYVLLQSEDLLEGTGIPRFTMKIKNDLSFDTFHCGASCTITTLSSNKIYKCCRWSHIEEAVRFLNVLEKSLKKDVIQEQLKAMGVTYIGEKKYTVQTIIRAFEYFALSRSAYKRLRQDFELPGISTLTKLTSKVKNFDDITYVTSVFSKLPDERQKSCVLILDEVYVKSMLQYHGGIVFGKAVNNPSKLANTMLCFMVMCLFGGPKILCRILPIKELTADFQYNQTRIVLSAIQNAGGNVVATICDGNRVNQAFFKKFDTIEPWRTSDNMFLLYDFVHLMKNIRNNWITEKCQELEFTCDGVLKVARWSDIKKLHQLETNQLVKMSKLSDVAVRPKPIERQKVSTCLHVFCDETIAALKSHPEITYAEGTTLFLSKMLEFWTIVNVHTLNADVRLRDERRSVIRSPADVNLKKLVELGTMVQQMSSSGKRVRSLSKDTSNGFFHTCRGLVDLSIHLLDRTHNYVLLGNFTSDPIEKEFSKLRQGCGGTYFITVQQVFEKVAISKTKLLLRLQQGSVSSDPVAEGHSCSRCEFVLSEDNCTTLDNLPELEGTLSFDTVMALLYVAGYLVRKEASIEDTYFYFEKYGAYISDLNRGGLTVPGDSVCQWVIYCYLLFHEVAEHVCRTSLSRLFLLISEQYDFNISSKHAFILSNIYLKNYCILYTPRSGKEPKQKVLKLSDD